MLLKFCATTKDKQNQLFNKLCDEAMDSLQISAFSNLWTCLHETNEFLFTYQDHFCFTFHIVFFAMSHSELRVGLDDLTVTHLA